MLLAGQPALSATLHEPIEGRWWADVGTSADADAPAGSVELELGGMLWVGAVAETSLDGGRRRTRIVGGANGLRSDVRDQYYRGGITVERIARDILSAVGESLDPESAGLDRSLGTWQRFAGPAVEALVDLTHAMRLAWRVTRSGQVRLLDLPHAFPDADAPGTVLEDDGRSVIVAAEAPSVEPGVRVLGHPVHRITWEGTAARLTGVLTYHDAPPARTVQDHRTLATAGIDTQRADGSLDVIAASRYGLTEVPLYTGLPGATVRVKPGGQTLLGYAGSPRAPVAFGHRGGGGGLKIGTLVIGQNSTSFIVSPLQFFPAGPIGDAAALAARLALVAAGSTDLSTELVTDTVEEQ